MSFFSRARDEAPPVAQVQRDPVDVAANALTSQPPHTVAPARRAASSSPRW